MRDQPDGASLLDTARRVLREELLPLLPAEQRHTALMVANAMAIAARQLRAGTLPEQQELVALCHLLADEDKGQEPTLAVCNRALGQLIRQGAADPGMPLYAPVRAHLLAVARQRLAESNPRYLER